MYICCLSQDLFRGPTSYSDGCVYCGKELSRSDKLIEHEQNVHQKYRTTNLNVPI